MKNVFKSLVFNFHKVYVDVVLVSFLNIKTSFSIKLTSLTNDELTIFKEIDQTVLLKCVTFIIDFIYATASALYTHIMRKVSLTPVQEGNCKRGPPRPGLWEQCEGRNTY